MLYISVKRFERLTERALYKCLLLLLLLLLLLNVQPLPDVLLIVLVWSIEYSNISFFASNWNVFCMSSTTMYDEVLMLHLCFGGWFVAVNACSHLDFNWKLN